MTSPGAANQWPAEAIWEAISPQLPGFSVEILPQIDSTNSELMRRARAGQTDPVLLVAEHQTAGRGRMGRTWVSADRVSESAAPLTFSLGIALHRQDWSGLSLAVGVCVATALRQMAGSRGKDLGLKWPNDLWWQGRKLCGILIETSGQSVPRYAVIGIGINISTPELEEGVTFSVPPVGLQSVWPEGNAGQALQAIASALVGALQRFEAQGFTPFRAEFDVLDVLRDQEVRLSDGANTLSEGVACGVDSHGALLIRTDAGVVPVSSGEISVRPVSPGHRRQAGLS